MPHEFQWFDAMISCRPLRRCEVANLTEASLCDAGSKVVNKPSVLFVADKSPWMSEKHARDSVEPAIVSGAQEAEVEVPTAQGTP